MTLPPGPRRPALLQSWAWIRRPTEFLDGCAARHGTPFTLRFVGDRRFVMVAEPEQVEVVFRGDPEVLLSGQANRSFAAFVGEHTLFALDGEDHRRHRRQLSGPFHGARMRAYGPLMAELTRKAMAPWRPGARLSLEETFRDVALEVILRAVFGVCDDATVARLTGLIHRLTGLAPGLMAFLPALQKDLGPWSPWGRFLRTRAEVDAILYGEIRRAREAPENREDILARLVAGSKAAENPLSDREVRDELLTLLGAGHETTAAGLAWAFQWVLGDGAALRRLREELGSDPDPARIEELPFLDAVVQETLRISPPIPIVLRWLASDLELAGFRLPRGTIVCPCIHLAQHDPRHWPEPWSFRPERFLAAGVSQAGAPRRPFFPFGGGGRTCIGLPFAVYEMKVMLATVLARADLRLEAAPGRASRRQGIVLVPRHRTPVRVEALR